MQIANSHRCPEFESRPWCPMIPSPHAFPPSLYFFSYLHTVEVMEQKPLKKEKLKPRLYPSRGDEDDQNGEEKK